MSDQQQQQQQQPPHGHGHGHVHELAHKHESTLAAPSPRVRKSSFSDQEVHQIEEKIHQLAHEFEQAHIQHPEVMLEKLTDHQKEQLKAMKELLEKTPAMKALGPLDPDRILLKYLTVCLCLSYLLLWLFVVVGGLWLFVEPSLFTNRQQTNKPKQTDKQTKQPKLKQQSTNFDAAAGAVKYQEYRQWRADNKVDDILKGPPPYGDLVHKLIPYAYVGFDKEGHPLYIERTGKVRVNDLVANVTNEMFIKSHVYGMETLIRKMAESSARLNKPIDNLTTILDLDGLSFQHANAMFLLQTATSFDFKYYPERVHQILIVNAPWIAPTLWEMVKQFLDESTKSKVVVLDSNYKLELLKYIDADQLPEEYGGTLKIDPTLLLAGTDEEIKELLNRDVSGLILQEEYVSAGKSFKVVLAGKAGDEFIWSFVVKDDYDVQFSIEMEIPGSNVDPVKLKMPSRTITNKGSYVAVQDCQLTFVFDNSYSYFNGKSFKYHASVKPKE